MYSPESNERDAVLIAVIETLQSLAGDDLNVDASTNLVEFEEQVCDSLLHLEIVMGVEERLAFQLGFDEVLEFYQFPAAPAESMSIEVWRKQVVPALTVAAFAEFIRERYDPVSFEPISLLGSPPCPAAGYFRGITEIVRHINPETERFAPSTPIRDVLPNGRLRLLWWRLNRATNQSLPPLSFWLNHLANGLLFVSLGCLAFGIMVNWAFLASVWLLCLKGLQFGWLLRRKANPLPQGMVTFGDLARYLAGKRAPSHSWKRAN